MTCARCEKQHENPSEIDEALAWHDGDARAAIAPLLADCAYLRWQLDKSRALLTFSLTKSKDFCDANRDSYLQRPGHDPDESA